MATPFYLNRSETDGGALVVGRRQPSFPWKKLASDLFWAMTTFLLCLWIAGIPISTLGQVVTQLFL